ARMETGDDVQAERLLLRLLSVQDGFGINYSYTLDTLYRLGLLYEKRGDLARAEPPLSRAAALVDNCGGLGCGTSAGGSYSEFGRLLLAKGELARAAPYLTRAVEDTNAVQFPVQRLNNLAALHLAKGDMLRAKPLLERALE